MKVEVLGGDSQDGCQMVRRSSLGIIVDPRAHRRRAKRTERQKCRGVVDHRAPLRSRKLTKAPIAHETIDLGVYLTTICLFVVLLILLPGGGDQAKSCSELAHAVHLHSGEQVTRRKVYAVITHEENCSHHRASTLPSPFGPKAHQFSIERTSVDVVVHKVLLPKAKHTKLRRTPTALLTARSQSIGRIDQEVTGQKVHPVKIKDRMTGLNIVDHRAQMRNKGRIRVRRKVFGRSVGLKALRWNHEHQLRQKIVLVPKVHLLRAKHTVTPTKPIELKAWGQAAGAVTSMRGRRLNNG
jgi:hypothetical protein